MLVTRIVALLSLALLLTACPDPKRSAAGLEKKEPPAARGAHSPALPTAGEDPASVVAKIGERKVTLGEVDELAMAELVGAEREFQRKKFEIRVSVLEELLVKELLDAEAKKRGLKDMEALVEAAVEKGTPLPGDEEVAAFWEKAKSDPRMGAASFEDVKPQIVGFLHQQKKQEAFGKLVESLRDGADVQMMLLPPRIQVEAKGPQTGKDDAPITIVEWSDFECPYCSRAEPVVQQVRTIYGEKVRVLFRHFPLPFHANAGKAAEAAACADDQGKFWKMHEVLFANQKALQVEQLKIHARTIEGMDAEKFDACLDSGEKAKLVEEDLAAGKAVGVTGTPAFFVNGIELSGAQPLEKFKEVIDRELAALETK
ncbi:MAG: DsbA family protein [Deltaproteobacteria bacterium]|nr:DsbA family protein [Deltaproteobacteria bacterium]